MLSLVLARPLRVPLWDRSLTLGAATSLIHLTVVGCGAVLFEELWRLEASVNFGLEGYGELVLCFRLLYYISFPLVLQLYLLLHFYVVTYF